MRQIRLQILLTVILCLLFASTVCAGIHRIQYNGADWAAAPLVSGNYTSVCPNCHPDRIGTCYAARTDGGIDWIRYDGSGWVVEPILTNGTKYVDICRTSDASGQLVGVREDGAVDWIHWWDGTWQATTWVTGNYVSICPKMGGDGYYAARADDGIDWIVWTGSWIASPLIRGKRFTDLAPDLRNNGFMFGVREDGGIDWIAWNGGWEFSPLVDGNYASVAGNTYRPDTLFGAKTTGGIDNVEWNGGWGATPIFGNSYSDICDDGNGQGFLFGVSNLSAPQELSVTAAMQGTNGVLVKCTGIVTATFSNYFYIESEDRSTGIRIAKTDNMATLGSKATVTGYTNVLPTGERFISAEEIIFNTSDTVITPVLLTLKSVGGGNLGEALLQRGQYGVEGGAGLNNVGLLVRVTGEFKGPLTPTYFFLDDGSGVSCKIIDNGKFIEAGEGNFVSITGIVSLDRDDNGKLQRSILFLSGELIR